MYIYTRIEASRYVCIHMYSRIYVRVTYKDTYLGKIKEIIEDYGIL